MQLNPMSLAGRCVLVTGASSGIGRETAVLLSELQAKLILNGRDPARLEQTRQRLSGEGHAVAPFDLTALDQIPQWLHTLTGEHGRLHGLVHAAGMQWTLPVRAVSPEKLEQVIRVNFSSAVMLARGLSQKACRAPETSLVFLASVMGLAAKPAISVYAGTKAALMGFTRSLAVELARDKVRVNCLAPGFVKTEMFEQMERLLTPEQLTALEQAHPLGFGTARDVASAAAFLIADTGRWITGSTLVIDGGYSAT
jgi:NAD(P)-dependent dehydrogenase (short-subunit alcohol dehydrogenase family)